MLSDITFWYHNFYTMEVKTFNGKTYKCIKVIKERVNDYQIALGSDYLKKWSISHTNPMTLKLVMRRHVMDVHVQQNDFILTMMISILGSAV